MVDTKSQVYAVRLMDAVTDPAQRQGIVERVATRLSPRLQFNPVVLDRVLAQGQQSLLETASIDTARHALGVFREEGLMVALGAKESAEAAATDDGTEGVYQHPGRFVSLRWKILGIVLVPLVLLGGLWVFNTLVQRPTDTKQLIAEGAVQSARYLSEWLSHLSHDNDGKVDLPETQRILEHVVSAAVLPTNFAAVTDKTGKIIAVYAANSSSQGDPARTLSAWREKEPREAALVEQMASATTRYQDPPSGEPVFSLSATDPIAREVVLQDGKRMLLIGHPVETTGGALILSISTDTVNQHVSNDLRTTLIYLAAALVVSLLLALVFARGLINRLLGLAYSADEISMGNLGAEIDTRSRDEIGDVGQAIDRMRVSLETAMSRLSRK